MDKRKKKEDPEDFDRMENLPPINRCVIEFTEACENDDPYGAVIAYNKTMEIFAEEEGIDAEELKIDINDPDIKACKK